MLGCKQVMPHRFMTPERLVALMASERVTVSAGVPTIWQGVKAFVEANPDAYDLSALSRVTCGGSAPPKSLIRWFHEALDVEMIQGWGMTETSPLATLSRRHMKHKHPGLSLDEQFDNVAKAGLLMPGLELDIFDEDFNRLPHDGVAVGEILVRGPWICSEYYRNPQPDRFHDGWLLTGDVGKIDPEEYLVIADRSKDLVKSGGEWISSVDLENHIVALEGVAQACVVAQPHPKWDERPVALVVLDGDTAVDAAAILDHCATQFAKWQLPDDILFVTSIPLTSTGKMDKKIVRGELDADGYVLPSCAWHRSTRDDPLPTRRKPARALGARAGFPASGAVHRRHRPHADDRDPRGRPSRGRLPGMGGFRRARDQRLTTILQARRLGPVGAGYPLLMGTSGAFIAVSVTALVEGGPGMLATLVFVSALFQFLLAARLSWVRRVITPRWRAP